ncbi:hypothetical protein LIER_38896 [Lithospermum erythrorhizon]|uniref:Uncharacterized protein n=1 Tax=Lithospermum erythrorhizon TaxID=34254 RepID=A0AAV3Q9F6_LITER
MSGLMPNLDKSTCYYAGTIDEQIAKLGEIMKISTCSLPVSIEKRVRQFLWSGSKDEKAHSKVAWSQISKKKDRGRLGIKRLRMWNMACMSFHIWNLCGTKETIWVKWIHTYKLRGQSFWVIEGKSINSWVWRKLLRLKEAVRAHVKVQIGSGCESSFLYDNWHQLGLLYKILNDIEISLMRI